MIAPHKRCGARKHNGDRCMGWAMPGTGRCKYHGGMTPVGPFSANFKTGKYSKYLPTGLIEIYKESLTDEDLLSLQDEIRLVDVRMRELLSQLESGPSDRVWEKAQGLIGTLKTFYEVGQFDKFPATLKALDDLVLQAVSTKEIWQAVLQLIEARRKVVEGERKRLVEMNQVITAENALVLVSALASAVRKHVTDRAILAQISKELVFITAGQPGEVFGSVKFTE